MTETTAADGQTPDEAEYDPHADPQWSEDGHWWWDGGQWISAAERDAQLADPQLFREAEAKAARAKVAQLEAARVAEEQAAREHAAEAARAKAERLAEQRAEAAARREAERVAAAQAEAEAARAAQQQAEAKAPAPAQPKEAVRPTTTLPAERSGLGTRTRIRIVLGGLLVAMLLAGVAVAAANRHQQPNKPTPPGGNAGSTLLSASKAEQAFHDKHATYTGSILDLMPLGFRPAKGVTLTVLRADAGTYCLSGAEGAVTYYLSSADLTVSRTPCS